MADKAPLAVYIHWPYCARICPYCDFNVYKSRGQDDGLLQAILKDLQWWRAESGERDITSIHFGGGTPSLLPPQNIERLINKVDVLWGIRKDTEIALEANPNDADEAKWKEYRSAGLTRLSLGLQTFNDGALKLLGRDHNANQALSALHASNGIFSSVSADLIFGWVGQTQADLAHDLDILIQAGTPHISTYQLTIEPDTAFAKAEARGQKRAVDEEESADFFEQVIQTLSAEDFEHYEVSNFAKKDHQSQHNLAYWRGYDYVGIGPGAHGRLTRNGVKSATIASLTPAAYAQSVIEKGNGLEVQDTLTPEQRAEEYVLMGLRINEGISLHTVKEISGQELSQSKIEPLIEMGLLKQDGTRLIATPQGRMVLNAVTDALLL
jgi:oxygen-independent coproporphyrinogen-3 oxidase